jgi:adenylosuccinate synthase
MRHQIQRSFAEELLEAPIHIVSVGPDREQTLVIQP